MFRVCSTAALAPDERSRLGRNGCGPLTLGLESLQLQLAERKSFEQR
ncbi:MAG: hypothetical protein U0836_10435 [Pirellulales bacterium]